MSAPIVNSYTFKLGWKYCLLEPMDLVQITDARLGPSALTVRITAVEEDDEGTLSITAEIFLVATWSRRPPLHPETQVNPWTRDSKPSPIGCCNPT
jgi:hypothetical protein